MHVSLVAGHASANPKPRPGNLTHLSRAGTAKRWEKYHITLVRAGGGGNPGNSSPGRIWRDVSISHKRTLSGVRHCKTAGGPVSHLTKCTQGSAYGLSSRLKLAEPPAASNDSHDNIGTEDFAGPSIQTIRNRCRSGKFFSLRSSHCELADTRCRALGTVEISSTRGLAQIIKDILRGKKKQLCS